MAGKIASRAVACQELDRDRYGRMVAKCTVAGEDLGEWLVANGWALEALSIPPNHKLALGTEALANKNARTAWTLLAHGGTYRQPAITAA